MSQIDAKTLLEAGVHFGHRTDKWCPRMAPYIYEARNGIHIINLKKTIEQLEAAQEFLKKTTSEGGKVLFVGTKKAAQETVKEMAIRSHSFYVTERWLGGTLTNLNTIRRSVLRMKEIDEMEASGKFKGMPKQEVSALRRESAKIHRNLDGIRDMEKPPAAMVVIDTAREYIAIQEAKRLKIPVIGLNDTNSDPSDSEIPIPANDDAIRSIKMLVDILCGAIAEGNAANTKRKDKEPKSAPKAKAAAKASAKAAPKAKARPKAKAKPA
jgi:small subunit ribosomal protein S2